MKSKRNETFGNVIFGTNVIQRTWTLRQAMNEEGTRQGALLPHLQARPPPSWGPCCSTDVLLPPIYTYVPPNYQIRSQNPISTAATFCTREIPSWGLFRRSAGGAVITKGFYINTIASPMMCEQFTSDLRAHSYQLDGFFSLFGSQYNVLLDLLGDLFDVTLFAVCLLRFDELWFMIKFIYEQYLILL